MTIMESVLERIANSLEIIANKGLSINAQAQSNMDKNPGISKMYTSNDLQELGFSRTKAFAILSDPTLHVIRVGRRKYVRAEDLNKYLNKKEEVVKSNE